MLKSKHFHPRLAQVSCSRCGKPLTTTTHSLPGLAALKAQTPILCSGCATFQEVYELAEAMGQILAHGDRLLRRPNA